MKCLALWVSLAIAGPALADEITLKNGASFTGIVREEGDRVTVELDFGTMTFKRVDVRAIVKAVDPMKEFEEKLKTSTDKKGLYELAVWAREKGLGTRSTELLKKVIALDPDHEGARKLLGYEKVNGRWLTADEANEARGLVKYDGRWLPREMVERMQLDDKQIKLELDRLATEERIESARRAVELAQIQAAKEKVGPLYGYGYPALGYSLGVYYPRQVWGMSGGWFGSDPAPRRSRWEPPSRTRQDSRP
jgi:hypothetical protein